jgi:hypothetical protein
MDHTTDLGCRRWGSANWGSEPIIPCSSVKRRVSSDQVISVVHNAARDDCSHVAPNALTSAQTCPRPGCDYADVAFGQPGGILARRSFRFAIALGTTWWLVVVVARSLRLLSVDLTTLLMMLGVAVTVPLALHVALEPASRPLKTQGSDQFTAFEPGCRHFRSCHRPQASSPWRGPGPRSSESPPRARPSGTPRSGWCRTGSRPTHQGSS